MRRNQHSFQFYRYCIFLYLIRYLLYLNYLEQLSEIEENIPTSPSSPVDNELLYHGRRYDSESNLYYYRARYYDPILGRFLSTDPMGYKDSMNLYQAFNMNGYNFVDPMGEAVIVLDPGHGSRYYLVDSKTGKFKRDKKGNKTPANDVGATRMLFRGEEKYEKDQVLKLAKNLKRLLVKSGHTVHLTRDKTLFDKVRSRFQFRRDIAVKENADLFISLHVDSYRPTKSYLKVYYRTKEGMNLARSIINPVSVNREKELINFGFINFPFDKGISLKKIDYNSTFAMLNTSVPSTVLVESGNIQNPSNESIIRSKAYIEQIATGINNYARQIDENNLNDFFMGHVVTTIYKIAEILGGNSENQ